MEKELDEICEDLEVMSDEYKSIVAIGITGNGSSSTLNSICGEKIFEISSEMNQKT